MAKRLVEAKVPVGRAGWIRTPVCTTIITLLLILSGLWGSVFAEEIKSVFPFGYPVWEWKPCWPAIAFWIMTAFCLLLFFVRQRADDNARDEQEQRLMNETDRIGKLIRTQPPANFLEVVAQFHDMADTACELGRQHHTNIQTLRAATRTILRLIATLAQQFDGDIKGVRYAANVMWFKATRTMPKREIDTVRTRLRFCDPSVDVRHLRGILDLDLDLAAVAATSDGQETIVDAKARPLALPIPAETISGDRTTVLPGAPKAFVDNEPDFFNDAATMRQWCDEFGDFTIRVRDELERYFADKDTVVKSFISIPLIGRAGDAPFAVLNIHCDHTGLLKENDEPATAFILVTHPFRTILSRLLKWLDEEARREQEREAKRSEENARKKARKDQSSKNRRG